MKEIRDRFVYFSIEQDGEIKFTEQYGHISEFVLPRQPDTNDLDVYYLRSMLKYFDPTKDVLENEILDAFPVLSLTKDKNNKFYKLSIFRLREFYKNKIEEDEYIQASMKHLFLYSLLGKPTNKSLIKVIQGCLDRVSPVMYARDAADTVDCEAYELARIASYVPTARYRRMKLLKGWIEGALHFYDYSIMFFDNLFVGFNDFNENILDIKTKDLVTRTYYSNSYKINISASRYFMQGKSGLHYQTDLHMHDLNTKWFLSSPNNDNERDGKLMMFRNDDLKKELEKLLTHLFPRYSFRLNDVFKWNRYNNGGKFNSHYDTMFVNKSSEECSLYTLLVYLEVEGDSFMYLYGQAGEETELRLAGRKAYVIPHWVKHRVEGTGLREFLKTEIVFKNQDVGTSYHETVAEAFDQSCYYMLQSVRHPELKDIVSQNFNTINEARFYKTVYLPKLKNNIFFIKTIKRIPLEYMTMNGSLITTCEQNISYITDGKYYYFKVEAKYKEGKTHVSANEAIIMLSIMQLDIEPKKMFTRHVEETHCTNMCTPDKLHYTSSDFNISEEVTHWQPHTLANELDRALSSIPFTKDTYKVMRLGNMCVSDVHDNPEKFYFAACFDVHHKVEFKQKRITEISSKCRDGNYSNLNVDFIGPHKNIIKIRQHSFKNGITITHKWITTR